MCKQGPVERSEGKECFHGSAAKSIKLVGIAENTDPTSLLMTAQSCLEEQTANTFLMSRNSLNLSNFLVFAQQLLDIPTHLPPS